MRLLNRLLVLLFVRRKAQAHARAVLAETRRPRAAAAVKPAADAPRPMADPATAVAVPAEAAAGAATTVVDLPANPREALIRDALAARKLHEAEWNALTPAQRSRAIASLGEGMAAIVKTFRAA